MVYGAEMPFQAARSRMAMPLSVAIRYSESPRWTTVVAPYFGVEPEPLRVTVLEHAARASATPTDSRMRAMVARVGVVVWVMRLVVSSRAARPNTGQRYRWRRTSAMDRSARESLEQLARGHAATADQDTEVDDRADVCQVAEQHCPAVALDHADSVEQQRQRGQRIAERNKSERRHQQHRGHDESEVVGEVL